MKKNRSAMLLILAILVISMTFSCNGLFTPWDKADGMGTLTIDCFGTGARTADPDGSDVDLYKVSVIDEKGEVVVPATDVTKDNPKFEKSIPAGTYSVIVQAIVNNIDPENPEYIGRKNGIVIKEKETTSAEITMVPIMIECDLPREVYLPKPAGSDWGCGKLPEKITVDGYDFLGYFTDVTFTQKITDIPDTTDYENIVIPIAHFKKSTTTPNPGSGSNLGRKSGDSKYFYIAQNARGDGKGLDADNAMAFSDMSLELTYFYQSNPDVIPEVIFITDVSFDFNHLGAVNITGKYNGQDGQRITITGTNSVILSLAGNAKDIIFDGKQSGTFQVDYGKTVTLENCIIKNCTTGIDNSGTLTLSGCTIRDCSNNYSETSVGAINNSGWSSKLIIRNNTIIDNCSGGKGGAIMTGSGSELDVDGLTISGCSAENGGGIYIDGSEKVTLKNCTITGCTAKVNTSFEYHSQSYDGAGIYIRSGKLTLDTNCSISGCTADGNGNSIFCTVNSYTSKPAEVNGTSWEDEHWINDEVNAGSDLSTNSSLWQSAAPAYTPVAGEFFASQNGTGDGSTPSSPMAVDSAFWALAEYASEKKCNSDTLPAGRRYITRYFNPANFFQCKHYRQEG